MNMSLFFGIVELMETLKTLICWDLQGKKSLFFGIVELMETNLPLGLSRDFHNSVAILRNSGINGNNKLKH